MAFVYWDSTESPVISSFCSASPHLHNQYIININTFPSVSISMQLKLWSNRPMNTFQSDFFLELHFIRFLIPLPFTWSKIHWDLHNEVYLIEGKENNRPTIKPKPATYTSTSIFTYHHCPSYWSCGEGVQCICWAGGPSPCRPDLPAGCRDWG
jgi:hypothetical protein